MVEEDHMMAGLSMFRWTNLKRKKRDVDKKGGCLEKRASIQPRKRKGSFTVIFFIIIMFIFAVCFLREKLWYTTVDNFDNKAQIDRTNECELSIANKIRFIWKTTDSVKRNP